MARAGASAGLCSGLKAYCFGGCAGSTGAAGCSAGGGFGCAAGGCCADWSLEPEHLLADNPVKAIAATAATKSNLFMVVLLCPGKNEQRGVWFQGQAAGSSSFARNPSSGEGSSSKRPL